MLRAVRPPIADPHFREHLRRDFISGEIGPARRPAPLPPARPRHTVRWLTGVAAAAAVVIVASALNQPPRWRALPSGGSGQLIVNGTAIPVRETAELTRRMQPGSRVRLECTHDLDIVSSGVLAMQLSPGTEIVLPRPPGRWFGRFAEGSVEEGLLRLTTGRRFHGAHLAISTPEAAVQVTGTTLSVIAEPGETCVCVLEGQARVGARQSEKGEMRPVPSGTRCEVLRESGAIRTGDMRESERPKLADLRDRMQAVMD